ncbi:heterogeneous nuclear ribonucleoprotein Q-like [Pecten maximus]|uniref:heterogeneous nuclear ribonucleoprotein Q-like n=1 Tax=Pecten maximus TaxID=6579 RepID=UPI001458CC58|nr:heterogeneous nuclear ribonucleoprotein Q-like [Pecten maximus]
MTSPRSTPRDLFSVFVGHVQQSVTKADLMELFSKCGRVEDLFVVENQRAGSFNYGFVHFKTIDSAVKAVTELHRWPLHGTKLVVDLAKDTSRRIEKGDICLDDLFEGKKEDSSTTHITSSPANVMSGTNQGVKDVMYVSRLRETCVSLGMQARLQMSPSSERQLNHLDVDCLMSNISKAERGRVSALAETLPEEASIENVTEKLLLGTGEDLALGRERVKDFVSALHDVMGTVNTFLRENQIEALEDEDKTKFVLDSTSVNEDKEFQNEDNLMKEDQDEDNLLLDPSHRTEINGMVSDVGLMNFEDIADQASKEESSLSSSDDSDTCVLGGDSGVESDHKSPTASLPFVQHEVNPELQSDVTSEAKKPEILSSAVVQNYLTRASFGRGRGYGRGTPAVIGRGMDTFQGYGRGVGRMF